MPAIFAGVLFFLYERHMQKKGGSGIAHDAHISGSIFGIIFINAYDYNNLMLFFQKIIYYFQNF
jgi:membrane associated rhomboid family serine protease